MMRVIHATTIGLVAAAALGACVFASPAQADWGDGYHHRWHPHDGWYRPWGPPALIVTPRPYTYVPPAAYYAPPPMAYAPPPVVYAPPPAYYAPGVSLGISVR
jgi:hypothetical protein